MWTRLAWLSFEATRASAMNIWTKLGSSASAARIRLMTTCFSKPSGPCDWARKISAIPPSASLRRMTYRPTGVPGARDTGARRGEGDYPGPRRLSLGRAPGLTPTRGDPPGACGGSASARSRCRGAPRCRPAVSARGHGSPEGARARRGCAPDRDGRRGRATSRGHCRRYRRTSGRKPREKPGPRRAWRRVGSSVPSKLGLTWYSSWSSVSMRCSGRAWRKKSGRKVTQ